MVHADRRVAVGGAVLAAVYITVSTTVGPAQGAACVAALLLLMLVARQVWEKPYLLWGWLSWAVTTAVVVPALIAWGSLGNRPGSGGFVLMLSVLPLAAWAGPYAQSRHIGSRLVTVVVGHVWCVIAALVGIWSPAAGSVAGVVGLLAILAWRYGLSVLSSVAVARVRSRLRPGDRVPRTRGRALAGGDNIAVGEAAESATGSLLDGLPAEWSVMHSRSIPGSSADVDHLLVGPAGVVLVDSKNWVGRITVAAVPGEPGEYEYRLNGDADKLLDLVDPAMFEARRVAAALRLDPYEVRIVVAFTDRMRLPHPVSEVSFAQVWDHVDKQAWDPTVWLVQHHHLVDWVLSLPPVYWTRAGWVRRLVARVTGKDVAVAQARREGRFVSDLAAVADFALPPKQ